MTQENCTAYEAYRRYYGLMQRLGLERDVPVPVDPVKKHTAFKHKDADYDATALGIYGDPAKWSRVFERRGYGVSLLLADLYVIDCDSEEAVRKIETEVAPSFPDDFGCCPVQETRKGRHYVFLRPAGGCDHYNSHPVTATSCRPTPSNCHQLSPDTSDLSVDNPRFPGKTRPGSNLNGWQIRIVDRQQNCRATIQGKS
jgi:hypothetical protein